MQGKGRPSPAMVVAVIALVMAATGTGYAASQLAKNSVGSKHLKSNAVTSKKVKDGSLSAADFNAASLPQGEQGPRGNAGPEGPRGATGEQGPRGATGATGATGERGPAGAAGAQGVAGEQGPAGRSALTPLQNGETVRGMVGLDSDATGANQEFGTSETFPIPGSTGPTNYVVTGEFGNEECTGNAYAPTAPPDTVCVYLTYQTPNTDFGIGSAGDRNLGFLIRAVTGASGDILFEGTWAFTEGPD